MMSTLPRKHRKPILVIWGTDSFSETLRWICFPSEDVARLTGGNQFVLDPGSHSTPISSDSYPCFVVTSKSELDKACPRGIASSDKFRGVVMLAELDWDGRGRSKFYGYDVAMEMIQAGTTAPFAFASFAPRLYLLSRIRGTANMLVRAFPHLRLPVNFQKELSLVPISDVKWTFINCFLRAGGLWNFLSHQIDNLCTSPAAEARMKEELPRLTLYSNVLDSFGQDVLAGAEVAFHEGNIHVTIAQLRALSEYLKRTPRSEEPPLSPKANASVPGLLLIEDNTHISEALANGLSSYFNVTAIAEADQALELLQRDAELFSAVLCDLLLENQSGFWCDTQGIELLNYAVNYPHLVVHGLTSLPKSMVPELERATANRVTIWPKSGRNGLPQDWTFSHFAEMILKDISKKPFPLRTPDLGLWENGRSLKSFYHDIRRSDRWQEFWKAIAKDVEEFLDRCGALPFDELEEQNHDGVIPKQLCSFNKDQPFDEDKLARILKHRLLVLDFSVRDHERINLSRLFMLVGYETQHHTQYLTSILGFSKQITDTDGVYIVPNPTMTIEEEQWLNDRYLKIEDEFPKLSLLVERLKRIVPQNRHHDKTETILDLQRYLDALNEEPLPPSIRGKIGSEVGAYVSSPEMKKLRNIPRASDVASLLEGLGNASSR